MAYRANSTLGKSAVAYIERGIAITYIPPQHKQPLHKGWNTPSKYFTDPKKARRHWRLNPQDNLGAVLGPSGLCSFDIDHFEYTQRVCAELGFNLDLLLAEYPTIQGNPERRRVLFRAPSVTLSRKKLVWDETTVFELRAGAIQDVLPPSIHPDTGLPYCWVTPLPDGELREPPALLLELWTHWDAYKASLEALRPGAAQADIPLPKRSTAGLDVIAAFNQAHCVEKLLEQHGYVHKGTGNRWLAPSSSSGLPGVVVLAAGRVYSHHGSDPLSDGHAHDAFDLYRILDHGGDGKQAVKSAAEQLGITYTAKNNEELTLEDALARSGHPAEPNHANHANTTQPESPTGSLTEQTTQTTHDIFKKQTTQDIFDDDDFLVPAPIPNEAMLYGLAGEVGKIAAKTTEANPYAVMLGYLTYLSAMIGRNVYLPIGNVYHHPRLFSLHVGRSGRGRKGEALSLAHRIRLATLGVGGNTHTGGLSSREGMIGLIQDVMDGKEGEAKVDTNPDKRLWIVESEFSNVLHQAKRDGNTLSAALRDAWDGVDLKPATKHSKTHCTAPHITISAGVTPSELLALIKQRELTNGFAGRFLIFWAERVCLIANPKPTPQATLDGLVRRTEQATLFGLGNYPAPGSLDARRAFLTPAAWERYNALYRDVLNSSLDSELLNTLLERRAAMLLRLALLFAITDRTLLVKPQHIEAALAWVQYWQDSVRYIFAVPAGAEVDPETKNHGLQILAFLEKNNSEAPRETLRRDCFKGHLSADQLTQALDWLLKTGQVVTHEIARVDGKAGRKVKVYTLIDNTIQKVRILNKEIDNSLYWKSTKKLSDILSSNTANPSNEPEHQKAEAQTPEVDTTEPTSNLKESEAQAPKVDTAEPTKPAESAPSKPKLEKNQNKGMPAYGTPEYFDWVKTQLELNVQKQHIAEQLQAEELFTDKFPGKKQKRKTKKQKEQEAEEAKKFEYGFFDPDPKLDATPKSMPDT